MNLPPDIHAAAIELWNHLRLGLPPVPAGGMLVFGSNDLRVASHAADLHRRGYAPWILFSGARGRMTEHWEGTEAEEMARVARKHGVPDEAILIENRATNTGENIRFSRELLAERGGEPSTMLVVHKPYMERRTIAALDVQWPGVRFHPTSPDLDFDRWREGPVPVRTLIEAMAGDFQRLMIYPAKGFASVQPVPDAALEAFRFLVGAGYGSQCIQEE